MSNCVQLSLSSNTCTTIRGFGAVTVLPGLFGLSEGVQHCRQRMAFEDLGKAWGLIGSHLDQQQIVLHQAGYHGNAFHSTRGLTQGGILSFILFNILINAIVHH